VSGVLAASLDGGPAALECSRAGCRKTASWALRWRNPRIHAPERRKTWLACEEHLPYLREFLAARAFLLEVIPSETLPQETSREQPRYRRTGSEAEG